MMRLVPASVDDSYVMILPLKAAKKEAPIQMNARTPIERGGVLMITAVNGMLPVSRWISSPVPRSIDIATVVVGDIYNFFCPGFNNNSVVFMDNLKRAASNASSAS